MSQPSYPVNRKKWLSPVSQEQSKKRYRRREKHQRGSAREYVRQFQSLMLEIGNMAEEDKVFRFEMGLQAERAAKTMTFR